MTNSSRELGGKVVRGLAKVGLVWSLAVLAVVFMGMSAQSQYADQARAEGLAGSASAAHAAAQASAQPVLQPASVSADEGPRTAGIALAIVLLGVGGTVLAVGAARDERELRTRYAW